MDMVRVTTQSAGRPAKVAASLLASAFLLAACQTTGQQQSLQVQQPGDASMSCAELAGEIGAMDQVIGEANAAETEGQLTGAGIAVAEQAAIYGGAGAALGRALPAASVLSGFLGSTQQAAQQSAKERAQAAQLRRTSLMGIYQGRGCS